jgi:hypothetical protein
MQPNPAVAASKHSPFCGLYVNVGLLIFVSLLGCEEKKTEAPTRIPEAETKEFFYVSAEKWSQFALYDAPRQPGWIAFPELHSKPAFQSAVNPESIGLLPPSKCADCHADIVQSCAATAHSLTFRNATEQSIAGSLEPPDNVVITRVKDFLFETMGHEGQIVHKLTYPSTDGTKSLVVPIAFVVGSGNHGQSLLSWHGDMLCQTPVSYLTEVDCWSNSPGTYIDGTADFSRPATSRCMDCHNTWFGLAPGTVNQYDKSNWIAGVTCVRCHGPAREHIEFQRRFPEDSEARDIVNPRHLSRERANEVCAQCHSGGGEQRRPAFTYRPGQRLEDWLALSLDAADFENDDPHSANQLGRLMRSRCFIESGTLTCMDCHNPHQQERGQQNVFSQRCLKCHAVEECGLATKHSDELAGRCIDCHMPSRRDMHVTAQGKADVFLPLLRDHQIGVWYDVSDKVKESMGLK